MVLVACNDQMSNEAIKTQLTFELGLWPFFIKRPSAREYVIVLTRTSVSRASAKQKMSLMSLSARKTFPFDGKRCLGLGRHSHGYSKEHCAVLCKAFCFVSLPRKYRCLARVRLVSCGVTSVCKLTLLPVPCYFYGSCLQRSAYLPRFWHV